MLTCRYPSDPKELLGQHESAGLKQLLGLLLVSTQQGSILPDLLSFFRRRGNHHVFMSSVLRDR
jgi:hypothetical protein